MNNCISLLLLEKSWRIDFKTNQGAFEENLVIQDGLSSYKTHNEYSKIQLNGSTDLRNAADLMVVDTSDFVVMNESHTAS